jgi:hypothetical protein
MLETMHVGPTLIGMDRFKDEHWNKIKMQSLIIADKQKMLKLLKYKKAVVGSGT